MAMVLAPDKLLAAYEVATPKPVTDMQFLMMGWVRRCCAAGRCRRLRLHLRRRRCCCCCCCC